jgi:hypothetical protein
VRVEGLGLKEKSLDLFDLGEFAVSRENCGFESFCRGEDVTVGK